MVSGVSRFQSKYTGTFIIILLGLVFHELYKFTDIFVLGFISPVNESKWEHWKMAYSPVIIVAAYEHLIMKNRKNNYIFSLAMGILVFQAITFGLIELYDMIFTHSELAIHVISFFIGGILGQKTRYRIMENTKSSKTLLVIGVLIIIAQLFLFIAFTIDPPKVEYFKDSIDNTYGIFKIQ